MADWLNIAGGAAKGYTEGAEDIRRKQEFDSLQRQRQRVEKQQKLDDDLSATLKGIRPPGSYEDATPANTTEAAPGFTGPPSGTKKVTVTPADYTQAQAAALARDGRLSNVVASHQLRQTALQTQAAEAAAKRAEAQDTLMQAAQLKARGDVVGAARILQQGYSKHPDGHDIVIEDRGGVPHIAVAGPDGRFLQPPVPVTDQSVQAMIDRGITMLSPDTYMQGRKLDIEARGAAAHEATAKAAMQNAQTAYQKMLFETGDEAKAKEAAMTQYYKDMGWAARTNAGANAARGNADSYGTPIAMTDGQGNMTYGIPTKKGTGGAEITPVTMPAGWTFPKPQPVMNDQQKLAYTQLLKMDQEGAFNDRSSGKVNQAQRNDWIKANQLDRLVGGGGSDPNVKALIAAGPPKDTPAPAPAKAAPAEDTAKYTRSKIRGGWDYTRATRGGGKTRAEWAAEDAKQP
jgi:hypothetical protein